MKSSKHRSVSKAARASSLAAFAVSASCFAILAASLSVGVICYQRASDPIAFPEGQVSCDDRGFPQVDWDYWKMANPDVIGWITVEDTPVNYPIVQAPMDDPGFYLTHDVYRQWNYVGCPYLDAQCAGGGLMDSINAVMFGHNLGWGDTSQFATFANYIDEGFAEEHPLILIQTPKAKRIYRVQGASRVIGTQPTKRTEFSGRDDLERWYRQRLDECSFVSPDAVLNPDQLLTLCTCSYAQWDDERTLVYATPVYDG